MIEAERVGFGASGRNGGWCSALFPTPLPGMHEAMAATVDEVGAICANEEIDAHFHKGGTIVLARSPLSSCGWSQNLVVSYSTSNRPVPG